MLWPRTSILRLLPSRRRAAAVDGSPAVTRNDVQQPVGIQLQEILPVAKHRLLERPVQESHVLKIERIGLERHLVRHF